jgi:hypothetical protein
MFSDVLFRVAAKMRSRFVGIPRRKLAKQIFWALFFAVGASWEIKKYLTIGVIEHRLRGPFFTPQVVRFENHPVLFVVELAVVAAFAFAGAFYLWHLFTAIVRRVTGRPDGLSFEPKVDASELAR